MSSGRPGCNRRLGTAVAAAFLVTGCATTASLKEARGTGLARVFQGSLEEIWQAAVESVQGLGFERVRANEEERWIAAVRYPSGPGFGAPENAVSLQVDQGERVGVFLDSIAPGRWRVEVVTVRLFALDPAKLEWAEEIFFSMATRLDPERHLRIPDSAFEEPPGPSHPQRKRPRP